MKTVRLGDVAEIVSGATPKSGVADFWDGDIAWVTPADLSKLEGPYISATPRTLTEEGVRSCSTNVLPVGSVLLSSRAPIGHVAINTVPMATNQGFKSLVPGPGLEAKFLYHWLNSKTEYLQSLGNGATFKELSKRTATQIEIPYPPIEEQRRIAAILDRADALRTKRRQTLTHLDDLTQSIFHALFGDPGANTHNYALAEIGTLSSKFSDGPFGSNLKSSHYRSTGIPVVRLQNIGVGQYLDDDWAFISEEHYASLSKHDCMPGDVLIGTLGDPNLRACIQPRSIPIALNKADCIQMRVDPAKASAEWVCWLLNMPGTLKRANALIRGQTRSRISMGRLRKMEVPVPPLDLQHEFATRVEQVNSQRTAVERAVAAEDELFASLQSRAFSGGL